MKVFLTGATGFVGKGVLSKLSAEGHDVVCLVRPGSEGKWRTQHPASSNLTLAAGDLFDTDALKKAMKGCDAVIHLVGIIREQKRKQITFQRIHVEGTRNMLEAAKANGISRFVHMSALGARANATSGYHQSKYEAEQLVQKSGISSVIFRPSVIFGPGDEFVNMLADLVRMPITPVIGDGSYLLQPVARETVADVFVQALTNGDVAGRIFETGGPEPISYGGILDAIGEAIGKRKVRKLYIPLALMKPVITTMEGFTFFPITHTQLTMLLEGNACSDTESLYQAFSTEKIPFLQGIKGYLR
ncbi:complex I NDUFA9 subunit family protein [Brevibacillus ruminantium]|uniref:Complex I NDUFA9 subunit family protein n=1 Tax=Brevibacillus ruminantium TaxID=2950604 RepID=A0ABY4WC07_9BACL|nr:complex I NDUFA9 subunit family protein [Brevibacillus ruminantium]USG64716.1 complex I NDUFA9 subunit family protein [Brevibacillus ruminantium]